jgi:glycosyltransferase involved in cell wall biosynthesis
MGMKAAEYARDYDWSIIAREIIDVYKKMISYHKGS